MISCHFKYAIYVSFIILNSSSRSPRIWIYVLQISCVATMWLARALYHVIVMWTGLHIVYGTIVWTRLRFVYAVVMWAGLYFIYVVTLWTGLCFVYATVMWMSLYFVSCMRSPCRGAYTLYYVCDCHLDKLICFVCFIA